MTRRLALLLAPALLCACRAPLSTRLKESVQTAYTSAPCRGVVPIQWPYGYPVPADAPGRFKFFFYPIHGDPPAEPVVHAPAVEVLLDLEAGKTLSCDLVAQDPPALAGKRWPQSLAHAGMDEFQAAEDRLYDRTEAVASVYSAKRPPTPADVAVAKEYQRLFEAGAEPPLLTHYYRLNPAFWEWLRTVAGRSIPGAAR